MTNDELNNQEEELWDADLKPRERIFVLNYCTNESTFLNATAAYRETYTKVDRKTGEKVVPELKTCESNGSKLRKKEQVSKAIRLLLKMVQPEKDEHDVYRLLQDLALQSFFNPADVITAAGKIKGETLAELGEKAKCISQIKQTQFGPEITLIDRYKPMTLLAKYLNIVRPENQVDVVIPVMEVAPKITDPEKWNAMSDKEN